MVHVFGGLFLGWTLGANDAANVFGTGVASGSVRFRTAVLLTALFALLGAALEGWRCMGTLGSLGEMVPRLALVATLSAGLTLLALTYLALPASASQAVVGALIGVGVWNGTANFAPLLKVGACWVATPLGGAVLAFALYHLLGRAFNRFVKGVRLFDVLIRWSILAAGCYGAYALGANNVANATGPFVSAGLLDPLPAALLGGAAIGLGAITFSGPVMRTVGARITPLGPLGGLIAILAMGITVHVFTCIGVPVSTSQAIVGAVAGIGLVRGIHGVNRRMLLKVGAGWLATPFLAGLLAYDAVALWAEIARSFGG